MQQNWLERYYQQSGMEANGRTYEILGLRACYRTLARLFGEKTLPDTRAIQSMTTLSESGLDAPALDRMYHATRYYEAVHLVCATFTLPLVYFTLIYWNLWLFGYAFALFALHLVNTFQERYKRCLCWLLIQKPGSKTAKSETEPPPPAAEIVAPLSGWFTPARFETMKFYRVLGIERIRRIVLNVTSNTMLDDRQRAKGEKPAYMNGYSLENVRAFQKQTQTAEVSHIVGLFLHFPFLYHFLREGFWTGGAYVLFMNVANAYCALLQRYHRVRLARILQRQRRR